MSNAFASALFLMRNTEKVQQGELARTPVVVAQAGSVINKVSQIDSSIGKTTKTAIDAFEKSSKLSFGSKAVKVAGDMVNPLLIAAAGVRVATAQDKEAALYEEGAAMAGMFGAEALMKKSGVKQFVKENTEEGLEKGVKFLSNYIKPLNDAGMDSKNKFVKIGSFILSGLMFVGASIVGYDTGKKIGKGIIHDKRMKNGENEQLYEKQKFKEEIVPPESMQSSKRLSIES